MNKSEYSKTNEKTNQKPLFDLSDMRGNSTNKRQESIEEESENAETDKAPRAFDLAEDLNEKIVLQQALKEVIDRNDELESKVRELEQRLEQMAKESEAKDRAILELAQALNEKTGGAVEEAMDQLEQI